MARSARLPDYDEETNPLRQGVAALGGLVVRNPVLVGGSTAFLVTLFYVSANALWYQPHFHAGAFFSTREVGYQGPPMPIGTVSETTIRIDRGEDTIRSLLRDPVVEEVQAVLSDMKLYQGTVDGLPGPNTRQAVEAYQKAMGLPVTGQADRALLEQLTGGGTQTAGISPHPEPAPRQQASIGEVINTGPSVEDNSSDARVMKIQAGLKAFGNDGIEIDGVVGSRTKSAIKEFQSLFGLPVTGEPDEQLYAKMREIGLTN